MQQLSQSAFESAIFAKKAAFIAHKEGGDCKMWQVSRRYFLKVLAAAGAWVAVYGAKIPWAWAPTKIVPTDGAPPGHPFTIIDTPGGRLVDGVKAVFKSGGGTETLVDELNTHKPWKTAQGTVPSGLAPGDYDVGIRPPAEPPPDPPRHRRYPFGALQGATQC